MVGPLLVGRSGPVPVTSGACRPRGSRVKKIQVPFRSISRSGGDVGGHDFLRVLRHSPAVDHARFWVLIDAARSSRKPSSALVTALAKLPGPDIIAFDAWFWAYYMAIRREDLWAAVYAVRGGCSDDGFDYFRGWLISRGEAAVLAAIRDPESLEVVGEDELMLGAARIAYRKACNAELPDGRASVKIPGRDTWPADRVAPGVTWNPAFYAATFPKLHERYFAHLPAEPTGSITHERFWAILDAARAGTGDAAAAGRRLEASLDALSKEDLIGFDRWLSAYNQALIRDEVRAMCRIVLGSEESKTIAGFRGWLIVQGERAVHAATHDPDTILDHATHPPAACDDIILVTGRPLSAKDVDRGAGTDDAEAIPDRDTWRPDWTVRTPTVAELRARFPRLTGELTDEQLGGPFDASKLSTYDKHRIAGEILERTRSAPATAAKLEQLDQAVRLWPDSSDLRAARGRVHLSLGNAEAARADFDAVLTLRPDAVLVRWDRSKARLACGDREGALADAREAAQRVDEARAWLVAQNPGIPTRVRHPKFGDGKVVSADLTGAEPKLVIDFETAGRKTIAKRFVEPID